MKKAKLLLLTLLAVLGYNTAMADAVLPYEADFNSTIATGVHEFAVASNWKHIVGKYVEKLMKPEPEETTDRSRGLTEDFLRENGFI